MGGLRDAPAGFRSAPGPVIPANDIRNAARLTSHLTAPNVMAVTKWSIVKNKNIPRPEPRSGRPAAGFAI
jgi:hypothetical protein